MMKFQKEVIKLGEQARWGFNQWCYFTEPEILSKIFDLDIKYAGAITRVSLYFNYFYLIPTRSTGEQVNK